MPVRETHQGEPFCEFAPFAAPVDEPVEDVPPPEAPARARRAPSAVRPTTSPSSTFAAALRRPARR